MYYFIGIKGSGMAALACMLDDLGEEVCGSDLDKHFFTEEELIKRNIKIYNFNPENIKDNMTVIIGNAFLEDFEEVVAARNNSTCKCYRYHEFLGLLMSKYTSVAIAGSHGKTTTTTMAKDALSAFYNTAYLIGDGEGHLPKEASHICVEADEFRRHFLAYKPNYALITNIEIDHVDYFKDEADYFSAYQSFVQQIQNALFYNGDDSQARELKCQCESYSFGFDEDNDYVIKDFVSEPTKSNFNLYFKDQLVANYSLPFGEKHLVYDGVAVICLCHYLNLDSKKVEEAFKNFVSPKRRFKVEECKDNIFVDDYAHHPTEVKVTLQSAKHRYPDKKIVAIFKPHRASRVLHFANEFKEALSLADEIYLLDFTSIDDKQDGTDIDINYLANLIPNSHILSEDEEGAKTLAKFHNSCLVFMSSKDIYPLAEKVKQELLNE